MTTTKGLPMFEILQSTAAVLNTVTNRTEKHGDDEVPAISLHMKVTTSNAVLDMLDAKLRPSLYQRVPGQDDVPGVEPTTPVLRCALVDSVKIKASFEGWKLCIDWGIKGDMKPMELPACKVDEFKVVPHDGGTVDLFYRVSTSQLDEKSAGVLWSMQKKEVRHTLHAPTPKADDKKPVIDGTGKQFAKDHPGAAAAAKAARDATDKAKGGATKTATQAFLDAGGDDRGAQA